MMFYESGITHALHQLGLLKHAATVMVPPLTPEQRAKMQAMTGFGEASSIAPELRRQNVWLNNRLQQLYEQHYPQEVLQAPETLGANRLRRIQAARSKGLQGVSAGLRNVEMVNPGLSGVARAAEVGTQRATPAALRALKAVRL